MTFRHTIWVGATVLGLSVSAVFSQSEEMPRSSVLIIDSDAVFTQSLFGARVAQDLAADESLLMAENRRIQAELSAEEKALTEKQADMEMDAFRAVAEAFDQRVVQIRKEQEAKSSSLELRRQREQEVFINAASPILTELMREAGASAILERRTVLLTNPAFDITQIAIERLNATIGTGEARIGTPEQDD